MLLLSSDVGFRWSLIVFHRRRRHDIKRMNEALIGSFLFLPIREKLEKPEQKEPEELKETEDWRDRRELRGTEVTFTLFVSFMLTFSRHLHLPPLMD